MLSSRVLLGQLLLAQVPEIALLEFRHIAKHFEISVRLIVVLVFDGG